MIEIEHFNGPKSKLLTRSGLQFFKMYCPSLLDQSRLTREEELKYLDFREPSSRFLGIGPRMCCIMHRCSKLLCV